MSRYRGMALFDFVREYAEDREQSGELLTSIKNRDGKCALLAEDRKTCSVHAVKPTQCRTYPFWAGNVVGEAEWLAEASRCEGIVTSTSAGTLTNVHLPTEIAQQLIVAQVHARGVGENWTYDESRALLEESASGGDSTLISDFLEEFAASHSSLVVYEGEGLRVVDFTVSASGDEVADELLDDMEFLKDGPDSAEIVSTTRRLEFISSPHVAQTEMRLMPSGLLDHSHLVMPVHRAMATLAILSAPLTPTPELPFRITLLGAGGCAIPSFLVSHPAFSEGSGRILRLAAVEPEIEVLNIAERFFGCKFQGRAITKHACTAEAFITTRVAKQPAEPPLDLILIDAFKSGEEMFAPPESLLSAHFLRNLAACLSPSGFVAVNVLGDVERVIDAVRSSTAFDAPVVMRVNACSNKLVLLSVRGEHSAGRAENMAGLLDLSLEGGISIQK